MKMLSSEAQNAVRRIAAKVLGLFVATWSLSETPLAVRAPMPR